MSESHDYKSCPIKSATIPTMQTFDGSPDFLELERYGLITVDTTKPPTVVILNGCDKSACAWWDELKQCCAVLTIAKASRQK